MAGTERAADPLRFWSVTTISGLGLPKEALIGWAAKVTAERAIDKRATLNAMREDNATRAEIVKYLTDARWEKSSSAAFRGTELHRAAEALNYGNELPADLDPVALPYVEQYAKYLDEWKPRILAAEAPVYNATYSYAGTLDAIVEIDGIPLVQDVKTNDRLENDDRAKPPYPDIALQLVAYARAELLGVSPADQRKYNGRRYYVFDPELEYVEVPKTEGGLALCVFPDRYTLTPVRLDDEVWESFLAVREVARWSVEISGRVLGPNLTPKKETN
jgi:hypothetical protein